MKTLFSLLFVISSSVVFGQNQLGPRIEFAKDSTGTWNRLYILSKASISQPENVSFDMKEIIQLSDNKKVSKKNHSSLSPVLTPKWPFLFFRQFYVTKTYELHSNSIKEISASDPIAVDRLSEVAWILFIIFLFLIIRLHIQTDDYEQTALLANYALIIGVMIVGHFVPGLWTLGISVILGGTLATMTSKTQNWYDDPVYVTIVGAAANLLSYLYGWRIIEGFWGFLGVIVTICTAIILLQYYKDKKLARKYATK